MESPPKIAADELDFLKIWHHVFASDLDFSTEQQAANHDLSAETFADARHCLIGTWLHRQPQAIAQLPAFVALEQAHEQFHAAAAELVHAYKKQSGAAIRQHKQAKFLPACAAVNTAIDQLNLHFRTPAGTKSSHDQSIWSDSLKIGIPSIDRRHHAIATLIDQVLANGEMDLASEQGTAFLALLSKMILGDIRVENRILAELQAQGEDHSEHLNAHTAITDYLHSINNLLTHGQSLSFASIGNVLAKWYVEHLIGQDLELDRLTGRFESAS